MFATLALTPTFDDDATLLEQSTAGDLDAFGRLIERYHNLVTAIAFTRTGDRALSEDVAQETFIAAWKGLGGLRDRDNLRAWLCGIARNLGEKATRHRRRETVTDIAAIDAAGDDGPLTAMLAKESEAAVWAALARLPATYREPLVLFYREDQSIKEVAHGLGLTEETAKQRLSRGRQTLRADAAIVEQTLRAGRPRKAAAAAVLAAILALKHTPASAATRPRTWLLAAVGIAAAAGTTAVVATRSTKSSQAGSPVATLSRARAAWLAGAGSTPGCELRGSVTRADHAPIAGGLVALLEHGPQASLEPVFVDTDARGQWRARLVPGSYTVTISAPGVRAQLREATCAQGATDTLAFVLAPGGAIARGTIGDTGGGPIAGATVWLLDAEQPTNIFATRTRGDGSYELQVDAGLYTALAVHPAYAIDARPLTLGDAGAREDLTLLPGGSIEGTVVDDRGAPIAGAKVSVVAPAAERVPLRWRLAATYATLLPATSDANGQFRLSGLPPGTVRVTARAAAFASASPATFELTLAEAKTGAKLALAKASTIAGFVVARGSEKQGLAGARVMAIRDDAPFAMPVLATTDGAGHFALGGLAAAAYRIVAIDDGRAPYVGAPVTVDHDVDDTLIVLEHGASVRGRVEPASRAAVKLEPTVVTPAASAIAALTRADVADDGTFSFRGVAPGEYRIVATTFAQRGELPIRVGDADQQALRVSLAARPAITGTVVDDTGAPLAGVIVAATPRDPRASTHAAVRTDGRGEFRIVGIAPGDHDLRVFDARGQRPRAGERRPFRPLRVSAPARETLRVASSGGRVSGIVVDAANHPVADAWLEVRARGAWAPPPQFPTRPIVTDAAGRFTIDGVFGDDLVLEASGPDGRERAVTTTAPGADLRLVLHPITTLHGTVTKDGVPVDAFDVRLVHPASETSVHARGARGAFTIDSIGGELVVTSRAGYAKRMIAGETTLALELEPWSAVRGRVASMPGARIWVEGSLAPSIVTADARGAFTVPELVPGAHTLWISSDNDIVRYDFTVERGQTFDLEDIVPHGWETLTTASTSDDLGLQFYVSPAPPTAAQLAAVARDPLSASRAGTDSAAALWIARVEPSGEGARAGLRRGDRIIGVGMTKVSSGRDAAALLMSLSQPWRSRGRTVRWTVVRDGRELAIDVLVTRP